MEERQMSTNKKIKVLHVVGSANKGGVESIVMNYSMALKDYVEPTFVCFDDSTAIPTELIESIGGHYFVVPHVKHIFKFNKAFKKILTENEFDIIHSHVNTLSVFPLRVAKKCGCQVRIAHSHSQSSKKEFVRNLIKSVLKIFSKKYANYYIACGEVAGRYQFGDKAYDAGEVHLVKNAINLNEFAFNQVDRDEIRKELGIKENEQVVGSIGRLCKTKNQTYILQMAEHHKDARFVLVGGGPLKEDLEKNISEHNIQNVILYGTTDTPKKFYSAFDVFVLPSLYEGVPVTGIEAQTNGVYCLFSDTVPVESKISSYCKFVPIGEENLSKWINELKTLRKHEDHSAEVTESGFNIDEASKKLLEIYKELISRFVIINN